MDQSSSRVDSLSLSLSLSGSLSGSLWISLDEILCVRKVLPITNMLQNSLIDHQPPDVTLSVSIVELGIIVVKCV